MKEDKLNLYGVVGGKKPLRGWHKWDHVLETAELVFLGVCVAEQDRSDIFNRLDGAKPNGVALRLVDRRFDLPDYKCLEEVKLENGEFLEFSPQNLPSIQASRMLEIDGTESHILDMCAAPGGKTQHLADIIRENNTEKSGNKPVLHAFEKSSQRTTNLKTKLSKKYPEIKIKKQDSCKTGPEYDSFFDKILLDAPCSASGGRPQLIQKTRPNSQLSNVVIQRSLMMRASEMLKVGGVLMYSTCSVNVEENGDNVSWFLEKMGGKYEKLEEQIFDPWLACGVDRAGNLLNSELEEKIDGELDIVRMRKIENSVDDDTIGFYISKFKRLV
jgi:16S rRNA C967 or C1407 C5-methylase (RsmB/RsmF family)